VRLRLAKLRVNKLRRCAAVLNSEAFPGLR
jgi:hypothetical protein